MFLFLDWVPWIAANTFCVLWIGDCIMLEWFGWLTNTLALEGCRETLSTWGKPQGCSLQWIHKRDRVLYPWNASRGMVFIWQSDPEHLSLCSYCKMRIQKAFFCLFLWSNQMGSTPRNRQQSEPKNDKTIQMVPWKCCYMIKATLWTLFPAWWTWKFTLFIPEWKKKKKSVWHKILSG